MMSLDLRPFFVLWIVLATAVIALIVRRKMVASHEDDTLHVLQGGALTQQVAVAQKLELIDKWGKILTVIAVVFGLLVGAAYVYQVWVQSSQINPGA
jgi:uncharacterized membrane protein